MGWCEGTELFDKVIAAIKDNGLVDTARIECCDEDIRETYIQIIDAFRDHDWDDVSGSEYYDHYEIGPLLKINEEG